MCSYLRCEIVLENRILGLQKPKIFLARPNHGGPREAAALRAAVSPDLHVHKSPSWRFLTDPVPDLRNTPNSDCAVGVGLAAPTVGRGRGVARDGDDGERRAGGAVFMSGDRCRPSRFRFSANAIFVFRFFDFSHYRLARGKWFYRFQKQERRRRSFVCSFARVKGSL